MELPEVSRYLFLQKALSEMFGRVLDTPSYGEGNCIFKINNRNSKARCEICLKLTMKTPKRIGDSDV